MGTVGVLCGYCEGYCLGTVRGTVWYCEGTVMVLIISGNLHLLRCTRGLGTVRALYRIIRGYKGIRKGIIRDYPGLSGIIRVYTGIDTGSYGHCKGSVK